MRKFLISSFVFVLFALFVWIIPVKAQNSDRPKGLEDRGPLTKITFIHYRRGYAKPDNPGKKPSGGSSCYGFLANGAKWKTVEPYYINPSGSELDNNFVKDAVDLGVHEWEFYGGNIFGSSILGTDAPYDTSYPDDKNVVAFGLYPQSNVIAVTNVWGYFYGSPKTRELVEWDMLFNTAGGWDWGDADSNSALMDLQNIATHELGHSAGMDDLYNTSCNLETMYGYSIEGETIKRTLNTGDITGIQALYK